jgi:hypothetical protein
MNYLQTIDFPEFDTMLAAANESLANDREILILDDADKKDAKAKRAELNKTLKDFKANAKQVRDTVIGNFDSKVKEVATVLDKNQNLWKEKIEVYDANWKAERMDFIREVINANVTPDIDFIDKNFLFEQSYQNATTTENQVKKSVAEKCEKIRTDYKIAQTISAQVAEIFKTTLDVAKSIEIDKQQQEEQARREAVAKAEQERAERERLEILERQKERERQAMIEAELAEAKENGEVIDAEKIQEINKHAADYAEKESVKVATFTVKFEYKDSDYKMAWENPLEDVKERLQGLQNLEVSDD